MTANPTNDIATNVTMIVKDDNADFLTMIYVI